MTIVLFQTRLEFQRRPPRLPEPRAVRGRGEDVRPVRPGQQDAGVYGQEGGDQTEAGQVVKKGKIQSERLK